MRTVTALQPLSTGEHAVEIEFSAVTPSVMTMKVDGRDVAKVPVDVFPIIMTPETYIGRSPVDMPPYEANFVLHRFIVREGGTKGSAA